MKKISAICLVVALLMSVFMIVPVQAATAVAKGMAVSIENGDIDWQAVKNSGKVDFALIQAYDGDTKDGAFEANYVNATKAGVSVGALMNITATTTSGATSQANKMVKALENKPFPYPILVYIGGSAYSSMDKATVTAIASAACTTLEKAKYFAVLYMDYSFSNTYIDTATLAQSHALCIGAGSDNDAWSMRRTSRAGKVDGVTTTVSLFNTYWDFPSIIRDAGLNNIVAVKGNWNGIAWDQRDSYWGYNYIGGGTIYDTACGILSTCNAINYMNGAFPDYATANAFILEWARYANSIGGFNPNGSASGGYRYIMFGTDISNPPPLQTKYGEKYGFTMPITWTENWNYANYYNGYSYNNIYVNQQTSLKNYLANGAVAIAHVPGHFICLADYDPATDKFLVLDSYDYWTRENTYCDGVEWVSSAKLSGGLPALTVGGYCVLKPTSSNNNNVAQEETNNYPYTSGKNLMLYDGESLFQVAGDDASQTTIALHYDQTQGESSLKMNCTAPTANANKGGYVSQLLKASSNLSSYANFGIDVYVPKTLTGSHVLRVGFWSKGSEVAYTRISMKGWEAGWHNVAIPASNISGSITAIDALSYTWNNTAKLSDPTYFLIDNVRMFNGSLEKSAGELVKDAIAALPDTITINDATAINSARTSYNALNATEKAKVTNLAKLEAAEVALKVLQGGTNVTLGDVDQNGKVDAKDALAVLKYSVGKEILSQDQLLAAEVDGKDGINAKDALEILKYAVGNIARFPIQG